jgi:hypothetical protein
MTQESQPQPQQPQTQPHRPADDSEEIYFHGSPLLRGSVGRVMIFALIGCLLIALPIILAAWGKSPPGLVWLLLILAGIIVIIVPILMAKRIRYRISNYRIDFESGLLSSNIDTLELWHVEDLKFHQSIVDRMVGVGTITIISHDDTTPVLTLRGLPDPRRIFEMLQQRVIAVKRQRGVVKMDTGS